MEQKSNKNVLIMVVGVAVLLGAYLLFAKPSTTPATDSADTTSGSQMDTMNNTDSMEEMDMSDGTTYSPDMDLSGIHIMADGSVMLGDGTVVSDASVTADGMIAFPDGTTVEPAMDMR